MVEDGARIDPEKGIQSQTNTQSGGWLAKRPRELEAALYKGVNLMARPEAGARRTVATAGQNG